MRGEPLDELYLKWLYGHIALSRSSNPSRTHWKLAGLLFRKEFFWLVPNDDNRCEDGKDLRHEFVEDLNLYDIEPHWMHMGCSVLEMLIGLSRRLAFHSERSSTWWFWQMMKNLGLDKINDQIPFDHDAVEEIIDRVIWRLYYPDGRGGLFPLSDPDQDQRDVELWYQFNAYLLEKS